jgi:hypothetical protein
MTAEYYMQIVGIRAIYKKSIWLHLMVGFTDSTFRALSIILPLATQPSQSSRHKSLTAI